MLSRMVAACVNISNKSAKILREVKKSGELNIKEKKDETDLVTRADFLSQLNIIKSLESLFPKAKFCGEEGDLKDEYNDLETTLNEHVLSEAKVLPDIYHQLKEEDVMIWVDPLDGTKEYTQGPEMNKECTVLIGIAWKGKPIAGVMNQPFFEQNQSFGRYLWGIVGLGAYDSHTGKLSNPTEGLEKDRKKKILTTRSHITEILKRDLTSIPNSEIIHAGGAGYKVLCVIEGKADCYIYPRNGTKRWDTCAPEAILRSINGKLTDIFNNEYCYAKNDPNDMKTIENCYGLVATCEKDTAYYNSFLSDELKEQVKKGTN